mmetsp:Transcript_25553/g.58051  ORF Transcript_25553/g.58051 Transcript_25553/m.58051 type:complete len:391 (+) Transcript_25553:142-1314(+)
MQPIRGPPRQIVDPAQRGNAVASVSNRPAPYGVDQVRPKDAPDITNEEPERDRYEVELPRYSRIDMPGDGAVHEAITDHDQEGPEWSQERHPQEDHADPDEGQEAVADGVSRFDSVTEPTPNDTSHHVEHAHNGDEGVRWHSQACAECHHLLVVNIQDDTRAEGRQGEHIEAEDHGVPPHLRQPVPVLPRGFHELREPGVLAAQLLLWSVPGDAQRQHERANDDERGYGKINGCWRQAPGRPHQEEASHIHEGDAGGDADDGDVLGLVPQRREAAEEVRLEAADADAAQRVGADHPEHPVRLEKDDHYGDQEDRQQHRQDGDEDAPSGCDSAEDDVVPDTDGKAPDVQARHRGTEVVGQVGVVVLDAEYGLDLVLQAEEGRVAAVHGENN